MNIFDDDSFLNNTPPPAGQDVPPQDFAQNSAAQGSAPDPAGNPFPAGDYNGDAFHRMFWADAFPQPKKHPMRTALMIAIPMITAAVMGFAGAVAIMRGKGWLANELAGGARVEFTLPVAEVPQGAQEDHRENGMFTPQGLAKAVGASVVMIECYSTDAFLGEYGQGSGIIMSADGYILTNAHVISEASAGITVILNDETKYDAQVIGSDTKTDIAVLKIRADNLTPAQFADSDSVALGEEVVAIGSPAGFFNSVTDGVVSGVNRMVTVESGATPMACIQIDAAINPGNSGGALFNMWGQVIGMTSSKLASSEYDGIGFAISVNAAKPVIESLMAYGYVKDRVRIGIGFYEVSDQAAEATGETAGLQIKTIDPDCDIAQSALQVGDTITALDGAPVRSSEDVLAQLTGKKPGDTMTAKVTRKADDGKLTEFDISFKLMADE
ncbi:MAG: trypsin-like peptidase domain-containing protein [Oscillospiraceae bacterium]